MADPTPAPPTTDTSAPSLERPLHTLPLPFTTSSLTPLTQGAEALVYRTPFLTPHTSSILKYRPPKPYRHPTLDKRLTKARLLSEARTLVRVRKEGVKVPAVLGADFERGWLVLEDVGAWTVRKVLDGWVDGVKSGNAGEGEEEILDLMARIGRAVGRLHEVGVVHGDLTTSNLMLRPESTSTSQSDPRTISAHSLPSLKGDVILIDFGLASHAVVQQQDEDRAVDLYVLERAFAATHPSAERLFQAVLSAYGESYPDGKRTLKRLADVRLRGRKRSMLG